MIPGAAYSREMNGGAIAGHSLFCPSRIDTALGDVKSIPVFAIISTWNDADIVGANILHCFESGCDEVWVLDNDSSDDTVQTALKHGAKIAETYRTRFYNDDLRIRKQNLIIGHNVLDMALPDCWWVTLDADEFLDGPNGMPFAEALRRLPSEIRVVGSPDFDLYPSGRTSYVVGQHPAKFMTHGVSRRMLCHGDAICRHWKHPAVRYVNGVYDISMHRGNHFPASERKWPESHLDFWILHAPLRNEKESRERLKLLCDGAENRRSAGDDEVTWGNGAIRRLQNLDAIYEQRWRDVQHPHLQWYGREWRGLALYDWAKIIPELKQKYRP